MRTRSHGWRGGVTGKQHLRKDNEGTARGRLAQMDDAQLQRDHALHNQHDEEAAHGEYPALVRGNSCSAQLITSGEHENSALFEITIEI